jgi:iron complex outermembrane receptor protein
MLNGLAWAVGERDLDAETLLAYELGYRTRLFKNIEANLTLFWHEYDDTTTLSPRLGPPGLLTLDLDNRAEASLYGIGFDAKYPITDKVTLVGNYTFQEQDWRADVPFHDKDLMSPPKNKAMLGLRYHPTSEIQLSSHLYYVDAVEAPNAVFPLVSRKIDAYLRLDLRAEWEFRKDRAWLAVGVSNLLDDHHPEGGTLFLNNAEVPRIVYAQMRFRF